MLKILVVDDYADALEAWALFLESHGFSVITASTGSQAVARAVSEQPDIVMMDLGLPDQDGSEVAAVLQEDARTKRIPLVALTGHAVASVRDRALASGFKAVYVKPYDPEALVADLKKLPTGRR